MQQQNLNDNQIRSAFSLFETNQDQSERQEILHSYLNLFHEDSPLRNDLFPSFNELLRYKSPPFPKYYKVQKDGKFENSKEYLNQMYELLRESSIQPIKNVIGKLITQKPNSLDHFVEMLNTVQESSQTSLFEDYRAEVIQQQLSQDGFIIEFKFWQAKSDVPHQSNKFQQFKPKNLLILINESNGSILFGTVFKDRLVDDNDLNDDYYEKGSESHNNSFKERQSTQVKVKINISQQNYIDVIQQFQTKRKFIILETIQFWLPIYYNLKVLKYMIHNEIDIAFEDQILRGNFSNENDKPQYRVFDNQQMIQKYDNYIKKVKTHMKQRNLDESQMNALQVMMTKNLHYIEGPPGTGKSYIATLGAYYLSKVYSKLNKNETKKTPIFIVCKKNASLDSFLLSILRNNEKSVLRIGRTSENGLSKNKYCNIDTTKVKDLKLDELNKELFTTKFQILKNESVVETFREYGYDIKERITTLFIEEFLPKNIIFDKKEISKFQKIIFESWFENQMSIQRIIKFVEDCDQTITTQNINKLNNFLKLFQKESQNMATQKKISLIDIDLHQDKSLQQQFTLRNEKVNSFDIKQSLILELKKIKRFYEFDSNIRNKVIQFAFWRLKIEKIKQLYSQYKDFTLVEKEKSQIEFDLKQIDDLCSFKYIGMTTTGFTKWFKYIQIIKPEIVIVEEASEVEEWNMACILQPFVKHLIQLGDYQQLTPVQANLPFVKKNNIKQSQFERVLKFENMKGISSKLIYQRRMIPSLSIFPKLIYKEEHYKDHQNTKNLKHLKFNHLEQPVLFINHTYPETRDHTSHFNQFEAHLSVQYAHLLHTKYKIPKDKISILCMYKRQMSYIQDYIISNQQFQIFAKTQDLSKIELQVQTVDEFQGKENQYIILSCVRSNPNKMMGFLEEEARINVAFSRAKLGLIVIGAFQMFEEAKCQNQGMKLWKDIIQLTKNNQSQYINEQTDLEQEISAFIDQQNKSYQSLCSFDSDHTAHIGECPKVQDYSENYKDQEVTHEEENEVLKENIIVENEKDDLQEKEEQNCALNEINFVKHENTLNGDNISRNLEKDIVVQEIQIQDNLNTHFIKTNQEKEEKQPENQDLGIEQKDFEDNLILNELQQYMNQNLSSVLKNKKKSKNIKRVEFMKKKRLLLDIYLQRLKLNKYIN